MAIDVTIGATTYWGADNYSVSEDSTPLDSSDNTGGVGQFTVSVPEQPYKSKLFRRKTVTLADKGQGTTTGIARGTSGDGSTASVTVDSRLASLVVTRTAQPFSGTLDAAVRYYLGLVNISAGIVIDASAASINVAIPGWSGSVWDHMKNLCSAYGFEMSLVSNNVVFRPVRQRIAVNGKDATITWAQDATNLAQSIEVYYYNAAQQANALAYPLGGWNPQVPIQQGLAAGATQVFTLPLAPNGAGPGASLSGITQPVCVDSVDSGYTASSVYCVSGNDGLPIPAAQWVAGGGSLTVAISPDTTSIVVTVTASAETKYAPYSIAMASGTSNNYSSLRLVGSGIFYNKKLLTYKTGLSADDAPTLIGATIDNEAINTYAQAHSAAIKALARYGSAKQTLAVTSIGINRAGDSGSAVYPTFDQATTDPDFAGKTFDQVGAAFAGMTNDQFAAYEFAKVSATFQNQVFGNVAGARVFNDEGNVFRIRSASAITPTSISYTAEADCTFDDIATAYAGLSYDQVAAIHAGESMDDFATNPLRTWSTGGHSGGSSVLETSLTLMTSPSLMTRPGL